MKEFSYNLNSQVINIEWINNGFQWIVWAIGTVRGEQGFFMTQVGQGRRTDCQLGKLADEKIGLIGGGCVFFRGEEYLQCRYRDCGYGLRHVHPNRLHRIGTDHPFFK